MKVQSTYQSETYKEVTIENLPFGDWPSEEMMIGYAMGVANESPSSLVEWSVFHWPLADVVTVTLYTSPPPF